MVHGQLSVRRGGFGSGEGRVKEKKQPQIFGHDKNTEQPNSFKMRPD